MLADDSVAAVIGLWRAKVDPFDERTIGLVTTFAAQGAIAIQNVRLQRTRSSRARSRSSRRSARSARR